MPQARLARRAPKRVPKHVVEKNGQDLVPLRRHDEPHLYGLLVCIAALSVQLFLAYDYRVQLTKNVRNALGCPRC